MVTHWESSTRPLYVRTVWRDGQHHVVLRKEDEPQPRSATSFSRSRGVGSAVQSAGARKASSVSLSLAGVKTVDGSEAQQRRCKTSLPQENPRTPTFLQEAPQPCGNFRTLLKTSPRSKPAKNLNFSVKSHSVEIHFNRESGDSTKSLSPYTNRRDFRRDNSLSERVMIWLDLATQNGNYPKEERTQRQRAATAFTNWQQLRQSVLKNKTLASYRFGIGLEGHKREIAIEGTSQAIQTQNDQVGERAAFVSERAASVLERGPSEDGEEPFLTSELEENLAVEVMEEVGRGSGAEGVKRQLHIFMPDLPKKFNDCDSSILSSKISGCSVRKSANSRKI